MTIGNPMRRLAFTLPALLATAALVAAEQPQQPQQPKPPRPPKVPPAAVRAPVSDVDMVILDNHQRLAGRLEDDPEDHDKVLVRTINGTLRLRRSLIAGVDLGVTSRFAAIKEDDIEGLIAFARWARDNHYDTQALAALDKVAILLRGLGRPPSDLPALALYCRLTDEQRGPEAALTLYRWYRALRGTDTATIGRLDQLEAIVGRSDDVPGLPPIPQVATAPAIAAPPTGAGSEGLEMRGFSPEIAQYSNPIECQVVPLNSDQEIPGVKRALKIAFTKGSKQKAVLRRKVNLDATRDHQLTLRLRNLGTQPVGVAVAVRTGNYVYFESRSLQITPDDGWKDINLDLATPVFKSQASNWAHTASVEGLDELREIQILFYHDNAGGEMLLSGLRFLSDKDL